MNNKRRSIVLIVILSIITILSISLLSYLLIFNPDIEFSFFSYSQKSKTIYNNSFADLDIKRINIKTDSYDIEVKEAKDDKITLQISGSEKDKIDVDPAGGTLLVSENKSAKGHIGFFFEDNKKMVFYIPKAFVCDMDVYSDSGDIAIEDFENIILNLKTDSGDVAIGKINSAKLKVDSGDISINEINHVTINSDSGDVAINNLKMTANSNITSDSGDIAINKIGKCFIETKTDSGDVAVGKSDRKAEYVLKIQTDSGNIVVK